MHRLRIKRYGDPNFTKKIHTHASEEDRAASKKASAARDYAKNADKYKAKAKDWQRANGAKVAAGVIRRQRQLKQATPSWLTDEHWAQMNAIYAEARRLTEETGTPHEVDHEIPLRGKTVCGLHVPWNLKVETLVANRRKSNRL